MYFQGFFSLAITIPYHCYISQGNKSEKIVNFSVPFCQIKVTSNAQSLQYRGLHILSRNGSNSQIGRIGHRLLQARSAKTLP